MTEAAAKTKLTIIVTGPYASGKTAFVQAVYELSGKLTTAFDIDRDWLSWGLAHDFVKIETPDTLFYFFTSPGARRMDTFFNTVTDGKIACIVLLDSAKPETFREAKSIIETLRAYPTLTAYVIAANKQDLSDAWTVDDLHIALHIPKATPILPCSVYDSHSTANVLSILWLAVLKASADDGVET